MRRLQFCITCILLLLMQIAGADNSPFIVTATTNPMSGSTITNIFYVALPFTKTKDDTTTVFGIPNYSNPQEVVLKRVIVSYKDSNNHILSVIAPIKDAGPWNIFDNYWLDNSKRDRNGFKVFISPSPNSTDIQNNCNVSVTTGPVPDENVPEAEAAFPRLLTSFHLGYSASKPGDPKNPATYCNLNCDCPVNHINFLRFDGTNIQPGTQQQTNGVKFGRIQLMLP